MKGTTMSMSSTLRYGVVCTLLLTLQPSFAEEKLEIRWLKECNITAAHDPSLLAKKNIPEGGDCSASVGTNARIEDTRIGVEWPLRQNGGSARVISATKNPLGGRGYKACIVAHKPHGRIIDEWIVPFDVSCEGRSAQSPFFRRYSDGKVCLMPNNICIDVAQLDPAGQYAVHRVIVGTLAAR